MKHVVAIARFPPQRGRLPVVLSVFLQLVALLALVTVVRDKRPDPRTDPIGWNDMGAFVEFTSIASAAALFVVVAVAGLSTIHPAVSGVERARDCRAIVALFGIGVIVADVELICFGLWKGIWEMFGPMAGVVLVDWTLVFLVLRYLDTAGVEHSNKGMPPGIRHP
jgi:hypothetical protein